MERYVTRESIDNLIKKFGLPKGDKYTQDWEIEIASPELAIRLLKNYINDKEMSDDDKFTLMILILESVNDYMSEYSEFPMLKELRTVILDDYDIHESTLTDLADWEQNDLNEAYVITPFIRSLDREKKGNK